MKKIRTLFPLILIAVILLSFYFLFSPRVQASPPYLVLRPVFPIGKAAPGPEIADIRDNRGDYPGSQVPKFEKYEITFQVQNTVAGNFLLPYDPEPPAGIDPADPKHRGITVDALFLPPGEKNWQNAVRQPAFYYQYFDEQVKLSRDGNQREWYYPTGSFAWKVRFSPHLAGTWQVKLSAQDQRGSAVSPVFSLSVVDSDRPGFIKVSSADSRYFEFDNGEPFLALGFQDQGTFNNPVLAIRPRFQTYAQNGIDLVRVWISGAYGAGWPEWLGGRNSYDGYLPRSGIEAFHDPVRGGDSLTMVLDYEPGGDLGWYDACRFQFWNNPEAVKPHTKYRLQIQYWGRAMEGPRDSRYENYGLVGKIGGDWEVNCYEPGTSTVITNYGGNTSEWGILQGTWDSGENNFLPRIYLGLENVTSGRVNIQSISLREELSSGQLGPEILNEPSLEYELYVPEQSAYTLDKLVRMAEENGVALKLVIMDKNDMIYQKLDDDGSFVLAGEEDNPDGFYGLGRESNKTRWLQKAWWRYLQARWGYSPAVHSWEATNEGDPWLETHYQLTDEMGKFMHCEVFGVPVPAGDGQACAYDHPNSHLVTTSFWHSFPAEQFWANAKYPNVDYADVHAYISTSEVGIPPARLATMQWDAASYHVVHSQVLGGPRIGKPVVRGEAGIDSVNEQVEQPGLALDRNGVWLHNFLWSAVDPGGLIELYWWGENRETQPGPDGVQGLHEIYRYFADFMGGIPLNNGSYQDAAASASNPMTRVVGQKDVQNNRAHLWVQNKNHTWKNVVDGASGVSGVAGTVTLSGFTPNITLPVELHAFTSQGLPIITRTTAAAGSDGQLVIRLPDDPAVTDVGIKIGSYDR